MSKSKLSSATRKAILSSVATAGAAPLVQAKTAPHHVAKSLAAAVALLAVDQSADAGTMVVQNPNVTVGHNAGDLKTFKLNLNTGNPGGLRSQSVFLTAPGNQASVGFGLMGPASIIVNYTSNSRLFAKAVAAGLTWNQAGSTDGGTVDVQIFNGSIPTFTNQYYLFRFLDSNSEEHYGWMLGSLTSNSYNLISYAYETTAGVTIAVPGGTAAVPEPSSLALGAMGALVLGAAGVRKWKKDRQAKAV